MRQVLRLLGVRYALAIGLVVGIGAVILIGKALNGSGTAAPGVIGNAPSMPVVTAAASQADDGLDAVDSPPPPSTAPGATKPDKLATQFVTAWLRHTNVTPQAWYTGLQKYMTVRLAGELDGVDPAGVPASRITGKITLIDQAANLVEATVPVDSGTVTLRLLATDGHWLVDGVDWTRT
jgi:hypothetical protein